VYDSELNENYKRRKKQINMQSTKFVSVCAKGKGIYHRDGIYTLGLQHQHPWESWMLNPPGGNEGKA